MFSAKPCEQASFEDANARHGHVIDVFEDRLRARTAALAAGADAVCIFVNDIADAEALGVLAGVVVRMLRYGARASTTSIWMRQRGLV